MTQKTISAVQRTGRGAATWVPEGYDGETHYRAVVIALLPAAAILIAAATVLGRMLAG